MKVCELLQKKLICILNLACHTQASLTSITDIFLSWQREGLFHLTLEYVKFMHRKGIYRRHTLIWKSAWFLCKLHRKMLHISKLRGSPQVNLLSAAWNCLHNILSNSISCKQVSTIKGNYCGSQLCLADRPGTLSHFLLDMWHLLRYQQVSTFSYCINTHIQQTQNLCVITQQTHYEAYSIWIHFDELCVLQTWITKTFPSDFQKDIKTKKKWRKNKLFK